MNIRALFVLLFAATLPISLTTLVHAAPSGIDSMLEQAKQQLIEDPDEAEETIEQALALAPQRADVHYLCGQIMGVQASQSIFSALHYAGKSKDCFTQATIIEPQNTEYQYALMMFYVVAPGIAGGDKDKAWSIANDIAALDPRLGTRARLHFYRQTDNDKAYAETMTGALKDYPDHAEFYFQHGLNLQQEEKFGDALKAFSRAANASIDDEDEQFRLSALYQIGRNAVFSQQGITEGISALTTYINQPPENERLPSVHWAHFRLAQLYKLNKDDAAVQTQLALAAASEDKRLQESIDDFE